MISWIGPEEGQYLESDDVAEYFRKFDGQFCGCMVSDEMYEVREINEEWYLCCGSLNFVSEWRKRQL